MFRGWGRLHATHDWRRSYGAAARPVAEVEEIHGRAARLGFIVAVENGGDFAAHHARLVPAAGACAPPPS